MIDYVYVDGKLYKVWFNEETGEEHWVAQSGRDDYYNEDVDEFEDRYYDN